MLRIVFAVSRPEIMRSFTEALSSDPDVSLERVSSGAEALQAVRRDSPHLVIIDSPLPDMEPLELVSKLLTVDAMVNTAVVSHLPDDAFHEATEGLGVLCRVPAEPSEEDAAALLDNLKRVLKMTVQSLRR